jgi:hypothetical protein
VAAPSTSFHLVLHLTNISCFFPNYLSYNSTFQSPSTCFKQTTSLSLLRHLSYSMQSVTSSSDYPCAGLCLRLFRLLPSTRFIHPSTRLVHVLIPSTIMSFNSSDGLESEEEEWRTELAVNKNAGKRQSVVIIANQAEDRIISKRNARRLTYST